MPGAPRPARWLPSRRVEPSPLPIYCDICRAKAEGRYPLTVEQWCRECYAKSFGPIEPQPEPCGIVVESADD